MIKILIGIPVLNNIEITRACLQHLYRNTETDRLDLNVSVLIVDNGSEIDVERILKSEFKETSFPVYFLRNPQNEGVAVAWNQILKFSPRQKRKNLSATIIMSYPITMLFLALTGYSRL